MILNPIHHASVDSTQARALAALEAGSANHGDLHVAQAQLAGRGRRGTPWHSPAGSGLYASAIILFPRAVVAPGAWTAAGALALLDVIVPAGALDVHLKWPNDLVDSQGSKLAGVLAEARPHGKGGTAMILGMGANVSATQFPADLLAERPVTDLAQLGAKTTPEEVLASLIPALGRRLDQALEHSPSLSADFQAALTLGEEPLRVETPQGVLHGQLESLDLEGELVLQSGSGPKRIRVEHVTAIAT